MIAVDTQMVFDGFCTGGDIALQGGVQDGLVFGDGLGAKSEGAQFGDHLLAEPVVYASVGLDQQRRAAGGNQSLMKFPV